MSSSIQSTVTPDSMLSSGYNASSSHLPRPKIDRARGGIIKIKLTIPAYSGKDSRGDSFTIPERVCEFTIDLEQLPLVDVASYEVEERQYAPDVMEYPHGATNPFTGTFG